MYKRLPLNKKFNLVKKLKQCFNCFSKEHTLAECTSKNPCFAVRCGQKHHTSLQDHFVKGPRDGDDNDGNQDDEANNSNMNGVVIKSEEEPKDSTTFTGMTVTDPENVFL